MSQIHRDPEKFRRFADSLRFFSQYTNETFDEAKIRLANLNETWDDEGFEEFKISFIRTQNRLLEFLDDAQRLVPQLSDQAQKIEDIERRYRDLKES